MGLRSGGVEGIGLIWSRRGNLRIWACSGGGCSWVRVGAGVTGLCRSGSLTRFFR